MLPIFFSGQLFNISVLISGFIAFFSFSFAASSIYCLNDIIDVEEDRRHPVKCKRPLASGAVSIAQGYVLIITMLALSISTFRTCKNLRCHRLLLATKHWILSQV